MRNALLISLVAASLLISSCSTTIPGRTVPARTTELNLDVLRGSTSIVVASAPESQSVDFMTMTKDSLYWVDAMTENAHAIAITDLRSMTVRDRFAGMLVGEFGGLAIGIAASTAFEENEAQLGSMLGGMLVGVVVGALVGIPHTYNFEW